MSAGIFSAWNTGSLFPWIHISVFISVLSVLSLLNEMGSKTIYSISLGLIVVIGVAYRIPLILFPETLSSNDPDKYALMSRVTLSNGDYRISGLDFYGTAGGFHTYIAQSSSISGMEPLDGMVVIALLFGAWAPVAAAAITAVILRPRVHANHAAVIAGSIGAVAPIGIRMTYVPIAQSIAIIMFATAIILIISYLKTPGPWGSYAPLHTIPDHAVNSISRSDQEQLAQRMRSWNKTRATYFLAIVLIITSLSLSHKLPLIVVTCIIIAVWIGTKIMSFDFIWPFKTVHRALSISLVGIGVLFTLFQQVIITDFATDALFLSRQTVDAESRVPTRAGEEPVAAISPDTGLLFIFESHSHMPALLLISGIVWLVLSWMTFVRGSDLPRSSVAALLISIAGLTAAVFFSLAGLTVSGIVHPFRMYGLVEILLAGLVGIGLATIAWKRDSNRARKIAVAAILVGLLPFLIFSGVASPDFPGQERGYLTTGEMDGKEFAVSYVDTQVYTDERFQRETPYRTSVTDDSDPWLRLGGAPFNVQFTQNNFLLVNADPELLESSAVLYRPNEDIYETSSVYKDYRYELSWEVESSLDSQQHRTFSNRDAVIYVNN